MSLRGAQPKPPEAADGDGPPMEVDEESKEDAMAPKRTWGRSRTQEEDAVETTEDANSERQGDEAPARIERGWGRAHTNASLDEDRLKAVDSELEEHEAGAEQKSATEIFEGAEEQPGQSEDGRMGKVKSLQMMSKVARGWGRGNSGNQEGGVEVAEDDKAEEELLAFEGKTSEPHSIPTGWGRGIEESVLSQIQEEGQARKENDSGNLESPKKEVDGEMKVEPKLPTIKIMIVGASRLHPTIRKEITSPYCVCEVPDKPKTKFETPVIFDTLYPVWRSVHQIPEPEASDCLKFTVMNHQSQRERHCLGSATLPADRFLGKNRNHGFDGHLDLYTDNMHQEAQLRVKVVVQGSIPDQLAMSKDKSLDPWTLRALEESKNRRVGPGEVLHPRGVQAWQRLYALDQELTRKYKEKCDKVEAKRKAWDEQLLLPFNHKNEPQEKVDEIVDRLYSEANKRAEKHQNAVKLRTEALMKEMGPRDPKVTEASSDPIWTRSAEIEETRRAKLAKARADKEERELQYMQANSVHLRASQRKTQKNDDEEEEEEEEEEQDDVYTRLWEATKERRERQTKRVKGAEDEAKKMGQRAAQDQAPPDTIALSIEGATGVAGRLPENAQVHVCFGLLKLGETRQTPPGEEARSPRRYWEGRTKMTKVIPPGPVRWPEEEHIIPIIEEVNLIEFKLMHGTELVGRAELGGSKWLEGDFRDGLDLLAVVTKVKSPASASANNASQQVKADAKAKQKSPEPKHQKKERIKETRRQLSDDEEEEEEEEEEQGEEEEPLTPSEEDEEEAQDKDGGLSQGVENDMTLTPEVIHETQVVGKLVVRIEQCDEDEARQAYVQWNASRLHDLHQKRCQKFALKAKEQQDVVKKMARPILLVEEKAKARSSSNPSSPGALSSPGTNPNSPERLAVGERLYNDAFRRHADRRIKNKQHFGDLAAKTFSESVHIKTWEQAWDQEKLDSVFERMYAPPPRAMQIKLGPWSPSAERDDEELSEESAFQWPTEDLAPADAAAGVGIQGSQRMIAGKNVERRRQAIFKNMGMFGTAEGDSEDSDESLPLAAYYKPGAPGLANKNEGSSAVPLAARHSLRATRGSMVSFPASEDAASSTSKVSARNSVQTSRKSSAAQLSHNEAATRESPRKSMQGPRKSQISQSAYSSTAPIESSRDGDLARRSLRPTTDEWSTSPLESARVSQQTFRRSLRPEVGDEAVAMDVTMDSPTLARQKSFLGVPGQMQAPQPSASRMSMARKSASAHALDASGNSAASPPPSPRISPAKAKAYGLEGYSDSPESSPMEFGKGSPPTAEWRRSMVPTQADARLSRVRTDPTLLNAEPQQHPTMRSSRISTRHNSDPQQQAAGRSSRISNRQPLRSGPGEQGPSPNNYQDYQVHLVPPPAGAEDLDVTRRKGAQDLGAHSPPSSPSAAAPRASVRASQQAKRASNAPAQLSPPKGPAQEQSSPRRSRAGKELGFDQAGGGASPGQKTSTQSDSLAQLRPVPSKQLSRKSEPPKVTMRQSRQEETSLRKSTTR